MKVSSMRSPAVIAVSLSLTFFYGISSGVALSSSEASALSHQSQLRRKSARFQPAAFPETATGTAAGALLPNVENPELPLPAPLPTDATGTSPPIVDGETSLPGANAPPSGSPPAAPSPLGLPASAPVLPSAPVAPSLESGGAAADGRVAPETAGAVTSGLGQVPPQQFPSDSSQRQPQNAPNLQVQGLSQTPQPETADQTTSAKNSGSTAHTPLATPAQPEEQALPLPSSQQVNFPSSQQVNFPSPQQVDFPSSQQVNFPSPQPVNMPSPQPVNMPSTQEVNMPSPQPVNMPSPQQTTEQVSQQASQAASQQSAQEAQGAESASSSSSSVHVMASASNGVIISHKATDVCFDACECWPVWATSILVFFFFMVVTFVAFYLTASLYSKGLAASNFYRGGGYWLLLACGLGLLVGGLVGGLVPPQCWAGALYLGAPLMALFAAVILLGKRGAWLGALGGLGCGGAVGGLAYPSLGPPGAAVAAVVGLLLGIVLGFAPIFRDLKINERYITAGLRSSSRTPTVALGDRARASARQSASRVSAAVTESSTRPLRAEAPEGKE